MYEVFLLWHRNENCDKDEMFDESFLTKDCKAKEKNVPTV